MVAILTIIALIANTNALSVGTVSEQNVTKREANLGDLFPDWVPFKNKHGEELGEFVQVPKAKPKKRLAHPMNFVLKAVAEPQADDYFDKGQGDSENEEEFEKKDWSDVNRAAIDAPNATHTDISEIDGVVNIITQKPPEALVNALKKVAEKPPENYVIEPRRRPTRPLRNEAQSRPKPSPEPKKEAAEEEEDHNDYEESDSDKEKAEAATKEQSESEAKKAKILDSVDELKERHAIEQKRLSEKLKEEELEIEQRERDKTVFSHNSRELNEKYPLAREDTKLRKDYDDYEERFHPIDEKYKVLPRKPKPRTTTTRQPKRSNSRSPNPRKQEEDSGKLSVFKNPRAYMVDYIDSDTEESAPTSTPTTPKPKPRLRISKPKHINRKSKFSAKYTTNKEAGERVSLLPEDRNVNKEEPTLFFPKKKKNKKRKSSEKKKKNKFLSADSTAPDTTASDSIINTDTTAVTGPSSTASVAVPVKAEAVKDTVPASTDHKEAPKAHKAENYDRKKGGGREYSSSHEEEHHEEGKKAYEGVHKDSKSAKGHHDKENHSGEYKDNGGYNKRHEEESGHYGDHHHEEHGKKHATYEELGKHSKGHSTKGSHDIHKKEEYEKKVEFFEEDGDSSEEEKHGGHNEEHSHSKGGHFKHGKLHADHGHHEKGESGHFAKAGHVHASKSHKEAAGHESHGKHGGAGGHKGGKGSGKKWVYHHAHPAKTANLILIDRRADRYQHGPLYYG